MRTGVVDVGTNSTRLLIVEDNRELQRESIVTRLGDGVDASGRLHEEAMGRALAVIAGYAAAMELHACDRRLALMTSAVRDAANGREFAARVNALDLAGCILSGEEEARLTFAGATAHRDPAGLAVIDIGGGSTEIVTQDFRASFQVGVVRQAERFSDLGDLAADARATFTTSPLPRAARAIGVAGTPTSAAAIDLGGYDRERVEGHRLTITRLREIRDHLAALTPEQRRAVPGLHPDRAHVMLPGLTILLVLMELMDLSALEASEHDLMWGAVQPRALHG